MARISSHHSSPSPAENSHANHSSSSSIGANLSESFNNALNGAASQHTSAGSSSSSYPGTGIGASAGSSKPSLHIDIPDRAQSPGVSMYRVESDAPGHSRIEPSPGGTNLTFTGTNALYLSGGDRSHAEYYGEKKANQRMTGTDDLLPNVRLHEFKVSSNFYHDNIDGKAAPQQSSGAQQALFGEAELKMLKQTDKGRSHGVIQRVDETKGNQNYGISSEQIRLLQNQIKPGSLVTTSISPRREEE